MSTTESEGYYISPSGSRALKSFQYNGADNSLIYAYILKPLANFLVKTCVPKNIAPNSITLFGLSWMMTSYVIMSYFCPNMDDGNISADETNGSSFPKWIFLFNGIAMLIYQTLDNMDGVQARTTGSSSPLGLLFDHGCDAFNVVLGSTNWMCAIGVGSDPKDLWAMAVMVFFPMTLFYISTWEEYHSGKLVLPIINGPTEGLILGACQMFISASFGVAYWHDTSVYKQISPQLLKILPNYISDTFPDSGLRNMDLLLAVTAILGVQEGLLKLKSVSRRYGIGSLTSLFPMFLLVILTSIIGQRIPGLITRHPRLCLNLCSALFVEMTTGLMLNHMTKSTFIPYRWTLIPIEYLAAFGDIMTMAEQDQYLYVYATASFVFLAFKIRIIVHEICSTLRIWCFDIVTPYVSGSSSETHRNGHAKSY